MRAFLPATNDAADPQVAGLRQIGLSVAGGFYHACLGTPVLRGLARARASPRRTAEAIIDARWDDLGETISGWRYQTSGGRAGHDLVLRAALAKSVLGAQLASEVIYPPCALDSDGQPFDGKNRYVLLFEPGQ